MEDFEVYDTAGTLVHEHQSVHLYDDADTGADPQLKIASPNTAFAQTARQLGVPKVRLYVYPPLLADLIVPFTFLPLATASKLWLLTNLAALLTIAFLMVKVLRLPWRSTGAVAVLLGLFALFSTSECLVWGQITIFLLLLWMCGIYFYLRGWFAASGFVFAIATVIKLTPLLVIFPFLIWKEWKWLRAFAGSLLLCVAVICLVNTPASLNDYFFHVMPSMSHGVPHLGNKSLLSSIQLLYVALHHGDTGKVTMLIPKAVITIGKACSLVIVTLAILIVYRLRSKMRMPDRIMTLALFAILSTAISPVSWRHAYIVGFLALSLLWAEALRQPTSSLYLLFLTLCSIELGSFRFDFIAVAYTHGVVLGLLSFLAPTVAVLLVLFRLWKMRLTETPAS
jgi:alpha-1,2-mannosyltransferase